MDYCFLTPDGKRFRVALPYRPYFYVATREDGDREMREASAAIQRRFGNRVVAIEPVKKNDLDAVTIILFSIAISSEYFSEYPCEIFNKILELLVFAAKPLDRGFAHVSQVIFRLSR